MRALCFDSLSIFLIYLTYKSENFLIPVLLTVYPGVFYVCSQVYGEYRASLAFDLVSSRQKNVSQ